MKFRDLILLWLLTIMIAPFMHAVYNKLVKIPDQVINLLGLFPLTILFSVIFSIPTLLVVILVNKQILKTNLSTGISKTIIVLIGMIGIIVTLITIGGTLIEGFIFAYCIAILVSTLILETFSRDRNKTVGEI